MSNFSIHYVTPLVEVKDPLNDNIDVEVIIGRERFIATLFTLRSLQSIFDHNAQSGECGAGTYFWASDMILVRSLSEEDITSTIDGLLADGELRKAMSGPYPVVE